MIYDASQGCTCNGSLILSDLGCFPGPLSPSPTGSTYSSQLKYVHPSSYSLFPDVLLTATIYLAHTSQTFVHFPSVVCLPLSASSLPQTRLLPPFIPTLLPLLSPSANKPASP